MDLTVIQTDSTVLQCSQSNASYNSYEMKIISLFGLSSAEHQCPGQCPWDPGTHRISSLVDLFRWWETSRNSIGCHLDGRAHSRVYKRPGILFSRKDTGFLRMYKLGSHFFRSPGEKIIFWITFRKLKLTSDFANISKFGLKLSPGLTCFRTAKISLAFAPGS